MARRKTAARTKAARKPAARKAAARKSATRAPRKRPARALHDKRFPNESARYRSARNALLAAEMKLRDQTEAVAAMRRRLPLGGAVAEDYVFEELQADGNVRQVHLSQLFGPGKDTLVVYNFMFGPAMKTACTSCTSILDGLDGQAPHITQTVNLVVVAKSPIQRIAEQARARGWRYLRLLSSAGNSYNSTYFGEAKNGSQMPMLNVFVRRDGKIYHTYGTELLYGPVRKGQDMRHVDSIWPLNVLDYTPQGRGTSWYPQLSYD